MRLLSVSVLKLIHRPASRITLLALLGLMALIYGSIAASTFAAPGTAGDTGFESVLGFPDAYGSLASMLLNFAGLALAAYAGAVAGSEWSWGAFRVAIARGASRPGYVVATFGAIALLALVAWILVYVAGVAYALAAGSVAGIPPGDPLDPTTLGRLPIGLAAGWLAIVMSGAIAFAVAFAARSAVAGIVGVVALTFGEQFAALVVPADVLRNAPISASARLAAEALRGGTPGELAGPLALTALYLVLALVAAGLVARRAEVA
jgi:hypothetical protein